MTVEISKATINVITEFVGVTVSKATINFITGSDTIDISKATINFILDGGDAPPVPAGGRRRNFMSFAP